MNKSQIVKWEKTRSMGKKRFLIINCIVGWGIPAACLLSFLLTYIGDQSITFNQHFYVTFVIALLILTLAGILIGNLYWKAMESQFQKYDNVK